MLFPNSAKQAIAKAFYDKEVAILEKQEAYDAEGGLVKTGTAIKSTFTGNVRFVSYDENQQEKGIVKDIDVVITCSTDTTVDVGDLLQYQGSKYVVSSRVITDSHMELEGKIWQV